MDILLVILGVICLLVGLAGCFLPILPGPPVAYCFWWLLHLRAMANLRLRVGRVGIAGRVGTGDGLCYAHAGD